MQSTLKNMVFSLFAICAFASSGVAVVNEMTKEEIAASAERAVQEAITSVLPQFERSEKSEATMDELPIEIFTAYGADGKVAGYAIKSISKNGYAGDIVLMAGVDTTGKLLDVKVLQQNETPGLGTLMADEGNVLIESIQNKDLDTCNLKVKKDGGDLDVLTGATISSRAYGEALERAYRALLKSLESKELN